MSSASTQPIELCRLVSAYNSKHEVPAGKQPFDLYQSPDLSPADLVGREASVGNTTCQLQVSLHLSGGLIEQCRRRSGRYRVPAGVDCGCETVARQEDKVGW